MTEAEFDRILFQALMESASEENERLLEGFDENYIHLFSKGFNRKMYADLKNAGINPRGIIKIDYGIVYRKFFASAAAVFVILTGISFAVPEVRAEVWGAVIEWFENHIEIYFSGGGNSSIESAVYPSYIPEGYEKISESIGENNADIFYSDGEKYINFSFYSSSLSFGADNRISGYKKVKINDYDGYMMTSDGLNILLWQDDKYTYEINAQSGDVDLVHIAESLYNQTKYK